MTAEEKEYTKTELDAMKFLNETDTMQFEEWELLSMFAEHQNKEQSTLGQIERLECKLMGMIEAGNLIKEFENSVVDHYQREVDILINRIETLKKS
jgi:hypothetical protein